MRFKTTLTLGVASAAVAISVANPANAACGTAATTVTCAAPGDTVDDAESALSAISAGPDSAATFLNQVGSVLTSPDGDLTLNPDGDLNLAYVFSNAGDIGAIADPIDVHYDAVDDTVGNSFTFTNALGANIFGTVYIHNVTDFIIATNTGAIAGSLEAGTNGDTEGPVTITNNGTVGGDIIARSEEGDATVVANGDVGVDGAWGDVTAETNSSVSSGAGVVVVDAFTTTEEYIETALGGAASVTVADGATVGDVVADGLLGATVAIDGSVGDDDEAHTVEAISHGEDYVFNSTEVTTVSTYTYDEAGSYTAVGGDGSVTVSDTGFVSGDVDIDADVNATLDNAGFIGGGVDMDGNATDYEWTYGEDASTDVSGTVTTDTWGEDFTSMTTDVGGVGALTNTGTIGDPDGPLVEIYIDAVDGVVVDNSGLINGSVYGDAGGYVSTEAYSYSSVYVDDAALAPNPDSYQYSYGEDSTWTAIAADATLTNDADGEILGAVDLEATGNASVGNAGLILGDVDLSASGEDGAESYGEDYSFTEVGAIETMSLGEDASFSSTSVGGTAALDNTGQIGELGSSNDINIFSNAGSSLNNSGTIYGEDIDVDARGGTYGEDWSYAISETTENPGPTTIAESGSWGEDFSFTNILADASLTNDADGEIMVEDIYVSANGNAMIDNAGFIDADSINLTASGEDSSFTYGEDYSATPTTETDSSVYGEDSTSVGGAATFLNTGLIGDDQFADVQVGIHGDAGATVRNLGRINGDIEASSGGFATSYGEDYSYSWTSNGVDTLTESWAYGEDQSYSDLAADTEFTNEVGGLIVGDVELYATGNVTVDNPGAVTGFIKSYAQGEDATFASTYGEDYALNEGDGTSTWSYNGSNSLSSEGTGGDVTGTYSGSVGSVQFAAQNADYGDVVQDADGNSMATVTGLVLGSFTGSAGTSSFGEDYTYEGIDSYSADPFLVSETYSQSFGEDYTKVAGDSTLIVGGGSIGTDTNEGASLYATGNAEALVGNGGLIANGLTVFGGYGEDSSSFTFDLTDDVLYDAGGDFASRMVAWTGSESSSASDGAANIEIGDGAVGGNVYANSQKGGTTFTLAPEGEVGGSVSLNSYAWDYQQDWSGMFSEVADADDMVNDTLGVYTGTWSNTAMGGDVTAVVDGVIGQDLDGPLGYGDVYSTGGEDGLHLSSNGGAAMATVTGQVRGQISVYSGGEDATGYDEGTYTGGDDGVSPGSVSYGSSFASVGGGVGIYSYGEDSIWSSGTAELVIDAADTSTPVNFGGIHVEGFESANLTIAADNMVVNQTYPGSEVYVGSLFWNYGEDFTADPANATTTFSWAWDPTGGPATLINDGIIGYDGGEDHDGTGVNVLVESISDTTATLINTGSIYGSATVNAVAVASTGVTVITNAGDVTEERITTRTYTPVAGTALLDNTGLITSWVEAHAENGTINNDGVIRGKAYLGVSVDNYTTEQLDTLILEGPEVVTIENDPFVQTYTLNQNSFLGDGVSVAGAFGDLDPTIMTSTINATVNLNDGSVTTGDITGEFDEETGDRYTMTDVNLNGGGYLGLTNYEAYDEDFFGEDLASKVLLDQFGPFDPGMVYDGSLRDYDGGVRVQGVENLTKTGEGTFFIYGDQYQPVTNTNDFADYTVDVGKFDIEGGEIQLAVNGGEDALFGIRGDLNNMATLVLGRRVSAPQDLFASNVVDQGLDAIAGLDIYQMGDFTQTPEGTLVIGHTPSLMRYYNPTVGTGYTTNEPLGVAGASVSLGYFTTPEKAFGNLFGEDYYNFDESFVTLDGNLELHGTVELVGPGGGIYVDGDMQDVFSVSGDVIADATVVGEPNNFVTFGLGQRAEDDRTIVFIGAERAGYETVGMNENAIAAGAAMTNSVPYVVDLLTNDGPYTSVNQFGLIQDMATIISGFDSVLTIDQVSDALNELASGNFYGSLSAIRTTDPFVDVVSNRRIPEGASGFNLWIQPSGDFYRLDDSYGVGNEGAVDLDADNYGGSVGFGIATGNGEIGVGFGYGHIDASSDTQPVAADANTWMLGLYGRQAFGPLTVAADLVYGFSKWDAERALPTLARSATSEFDSKELRGDLRVEYAFPIGENAFAAPYGQVELRHYKFDGFTEQGAGAVNLVVDKASKTLFTPTLGVKFGTAFETGMATLRPEATLSYSFGDYQTNRNVAYLGNPDEQFRLQGVDPDGFFTGTLGLFADIGRNSGAFLRGSYSTGGDGSVAGLKAGVVLGFGSAPAPVPAPAPVVAPPPPPAPAPAPQVVCNKGPYIVFFDWDRSDITPEAATILDSAVTAYGNCDVVPIMLAGYADRSGSASYNVGLSQRRNSSVREYLTARGVPGTRITGEAFGESNPRVPTADGVRELQNRRVEITYGPGSGM